MLSFAWRKKLNDHVQKYFLIFSLKLLIIAPQTPVWCFTDHLLQYIPKTHESFSSIVDVFLN